MKSPSLARVHGKCVAIGGSCRNGWMSWKSRKPSGCTWARTIAAGRSVRRQSRTSRSKSSGSSAKGWPWCLVHQPAQPMQSCGAL
eukprot:scaffold14308_cov68-Phaeocystis_antarctica.AAC.6